MLGRLDYRRAKTLWEILICLDAYFRVSVSRSDISVPCVVSPFPRLKYVKDGVTTISRSSVLRITRNDVSPQQNKRVHTFVPAPMVASSSSTWEGTHGPATPFMYKYSHHGQCMLRFHALVLREKHFQSRLILDFQSSTPNSWNLCMYVFRARSARKV